MEGSGLVGSFFGAAKERAAGVWACVGTETELASVEPSAENLATVQVRIIADAS